MERKVLESLLFSKLRRVFPYLRTILIDVIEEREEFKNKEGKKVKEKKETKGHPTVELYSLLQQPTKTKRQLTRSWPMKIIKGLTMKLNSSMIDDDKIFL